MTLKVYDLAAGQGIPASFEDYLTRTEIDEHRRLTASRRAAGKPILHDEAPRTNRAFASWSLFLITDLAWLKDSSDRVASLYDSYIGYARAIGGEHAAVWFGKPPHRDASGRLTASAGDIDAARCVHYASKLGLDPSSGPYVVVLSAHPDLAAAMASGHVVIDLGGLTVQATDALLRALSSQLLALKLDEDSLRLKARWLKWRDALTAALEAVDRKFLSRIEIEFGEHGVRLGWKPKPAD